MRALLSYEGLACRMRALLSYEGLGVSFQYLFFGLAWLGGGVGGFGVGGGWGGGGWGGVGRAGNMPTASSDLLSYPFCSPASSDFLPPHPPKPSQAKHKY